MDMSRAIAPKSDQVNAEDLLGGPKTVSITGVREGTDEQKVFIDLAEFPGRTYRPSKTMARVLVGAWGLDASKYVGRRMTIFRNPDIRFGSDAVGGIQISHLSHIDKPQTFTLLEKRGKKAPHTVQPLADAPAIDINTYTPALEGATTVDALKDAFFAAPPGVREDPRFIAIKDAKKNDLSATDTAEAGA